MRFGDADSGSFLVGCIPGDNPSNYQMRVLNSDGSWGQVDTSRDQVTEDGFAIQLLGYVVDSCGGVLVLEVKDILKQFSLMTLGTPTQTRELEMRNPDDPNGEVGIR